MQRRGHKDDPLYKIRGLLRLRQDNATDLLRSARTDSTRRVATGPLWQSTAVEHVAGDRDGKRREFIVQSGLCGLRPVRVGGSDRNRLGEPRQAQPTNEGMLAGQAGHVITVVGCSGGEGQGRLQF